MDELELVGALDDRVGVEVADAAEGDEDGLVLHLGRHLLAGGALAVEVVLLLLDLGAAQLEEVVDERRDDAAVLALEARVLDDGVVAVADVAEALQAAHERADVAILEVHRALRVRLARRRRLLLARLRRRLGRRLARGGRRAAVRAGRDLGGGAARAVGVRLGLGLLGLLLELGLDALAVVGRDDVLPRRHVGLYVLDGELIEELLAAERGAGRRRRRVVLLGLVQDVVEVELVELALGAVRLEDVGGAELEDRRELLLGVVLGLGRRRLPDVLARRIHLVDDCEQEKSSSQSQSKARACVRQRGG